LTDQGAAGPANGKKKKGGPIERKLKEQEKGEKEGVSPEPPDMKTGKGKKGGKLDAFFEKSKGKKGGPNTLRPRQTIWGKKGGKRGGGGVGGVEKGGWEGRGKKSPSPLKVFFPKAWKTLNQR